MQEAGAEVLLQLILASFGGIHHHLVCASLCFCKNIDFHL